MYSTVRLMYSKQSLQASQDGCMLQACRPAGWLAGWLASSASPESAAELQGGGHDQRRPHQQHVPQLALPQTRWRAVCFRGPSTSWGVHDWICSQVAAQS
jgi:hypothetical protein